MKAPTTAATSATRQNAKKTRRTRSAGEPRPLWLRPFCDLRHALHRASEDLASCRRATRPQWSTLRGRLRALRRFERAYDTLDAAAGQLERAAAEFRRMLEALALEPERAGEALGELPRATDDMLALSERVARMSLALDQAFAHIQDDRPFLAKPRTAAAGLFSKYPSDPLERIRLLLLLFRRRRSRCLATEDAPRRVSRGRAPPFLSACSL